MDMTTRLELEVLRAIAAQAAENAAALHHQIDIARVACRENTGAGFFTTFEVQPDRIAEGLRSPIGDVGATVEGLAYGMGFLLWIKDGAIHKLEGFAYGNENTSALNFERVGFSDVGDDYPNRDGVA